ncbi:MAG: hypothetical protein EZS28_027602 [Streblomastix strix]|uniref:Uncharacterized protein n=1 Tax=Streblomastix strix TaxID=222440 RepID=A0A5J4V455_9EUKA|nr:MAG: hypothetical protein EZS28_027602 [Streblomastix strix]
MKVDMSEFELDQLGKCLCYYTQGFKLGSEDKILIVGAGNSGLIGIELLGIGYGIVEEEKEEEEDDDDDLSVDANSYSSNSIFNGIGFYSSSFDQGILVVQENLN